METIPTTRTAIAQGSEKGSLEIRHNIPLPPLTPTQVLVKIIYVSLQPCEFKTPARFPTPNAIGGNDFSGRIVTLGSSVPSHRDLHVGDRVYGCIVANNPQTPNQGAFSEYTTVEATDVMKTPEGVSDEMASTLMSRFVTCALAFKKIGLEGEPLGGGGAGELVLVYGGATSTGQMIIRALKLAGYTPIATCSPSNFDLVRSIGAAEVFDYKDPAYTDQIKSFTKRALKLVVDCICESSTMKDCLAVIGRRGGKYVGQEYFPETWNTRPKTVKASYFFGWDVMEGFGGFGEGYERNGDEALREYGQKWKVMMNELVKEGNFIDIPIQILPGRFQGILDGIKMLESRKVSGKKLVVKVEE